MKWKYNDGGRSAAGYKGTANDCVCRSIAIVTGMPYQEVYDLIKSFGKKEHLSRYKTEKSHPRTGVWQNTVRKIMKSLGWEWIPTMRIGSGCKVHLIENELPKGKLMVSISKHCTAVVNGVIQDTHDPSREGTRCVYGIWKKAPKSKRNKNP